MSKVNFIFWFKSPMNMQVKFFMKLCSVTNSSFFFASRPFLVMLGDSGDVGEAEFDPIVFLKWFCENITCSLSLMIPGSLVYSMKVTLSIWSG